MKRISTLFLGMMVALSMVAAPRGFKKFAKAPEADVTIVAHNLIETELQGYPMLYASDDNYEVYAILVTKATSLYGKYNALNCMLILFDSEGTEIDLEKVSATYSLEESGISRFVATGTDAEGKTYSIDADNDFDPYTYDEDVDFSYEFPTYEVDYTDVEEEGVAYVEAMDGTDYVVLQIKLPEGAKELTAGEYAADDQSGFQTFFPGFYEGFVRPSYAATLVQKDESWYLDKIWYLVSGTVTVARDGKITIAAKNSLGHNVNATLLKATETGIDNVKADDGEKAIKRLVNGKLVIERNGKTYDVLGREIK